MWQRTGKYGLAKQRPDVAELGLRGHGKTYSVILVNCTEKALIGFKQRNNSYPNFVFIILVVFWKIDGKEWK